MAHDRYISPFSTRYASDEMQYTFSDDNKFRTWRRLWIALAKAEQKQGLDITDEQIAELEAHKDDINYEEATAREKLVRHDVMSHVYAYGLQCPKAKGIIHLGATSCYVGDNTDVIIMREGLQLVRKKLIGVLANLADFAEQYKDMPCLAYTHCQPAQLTTVGKRATLWMNEFYMDLQEIDHRSASWPCAALRVPPAPRPALLSCSTAILPRSRQWKPMCAPRWALTRLCPSAARPTAARWTTMCFPPLPVLPRAP